MKWTEYLQAFGIIAGLFFTGYNILLTRRSLHVSNILQLAAAYRDIWKSALTKPELHRVLSANVDLVTNPITNDERLLMKMLILHAFNAFVGARSETIFPIEGLRADLQDLMNLPIPHHVWLEIRQYQNRKFVEFIEEVHTPGSRPIIASLTMLKHYGTVLVARLSRLHLQEAWRSRDEVISLRLFPPQNPDREDP